MNYRAAVVLIASHMLALTLTGAPKVTEKDFGREELLD